MTEPVRCGLCGSPGKDTHDLDACDACGVITCYRCWQARVDALPRDLNGMAAAVCADPQCVKADWAAATLKVD